MQTSGILYMQFHRRGLTAAKFVRIHSSRLVRMGKLKFGVGVKRQPNEACQNSVHLFEILRILCELGLFSH